MKKTQNGGSDAPRIGPKRPKGIPNGRKQCAGITKAGERCKSFALGDTDFCVSHAEHITEEMRHSWRVKGGENTSYSAQVQRLMPKQPMNNEDMARLLSGLLLRLGQNETVEPSTATAAATVAKTIHDLRHASALEQRLEAVERNLDATRLRKVG